VHVDHLGVLVGGGRGAFGLHGWKEGWSEGPMEKETRGDQVFKRIVCQIERETYGSENKPAFGIKGDMLR